MHGSDPDALGSDLSAEEWCGGAKPAGQETSGCRPGQCTECLQSCCRPVIIWFATKQAGTTMHMLCRAVLVLQSTWRMLKERRAFLRWRRAAVAIQRRVRGMQARSAYAQLRQRHAAATAVQAAFKGHRARQDYLLQRDAAIAVQMGFRRKQVWPLPPAACKCNCCRHTATLPGSE